MDWSEFRAVVGALGPLLVTVVAVTAMVVFLRLARMTWQSIERQQNAMRWFDLRREAFAELMRTVEEVGDRIQLFNTFDPQRTGPLPDLPAVPEMFHESGALTWRYTFWPEDVRDRYADWYRAARVAAHTSVVATEAAAEAEANGDDGARMAVLTSWAFAKADEKRERYALGLTVMTTLSGGQVDGRAAGA